MKKNIAVVFSIILAVFLLTACGDTGNIQSAEQQTSETAPEAASETDEAGAAATGTETAGASSDKGKEGDLVSTDYAPYAGVYTCSDDGSTVTLGKDGSVVVSITRLAQLDGKADGIYKGIVKLNVTDPNGEPMKMEFIPETGELIAVESKWTYIKTGDSFKFDKKP